LIYSENTIPSRGHFRAQEFIKEFNEELNLTLSTEEIDEIITRDYNNIENEQSKIKTKNPIRFIKTMFKSK